MILPAFWHRLAAWTIATGFLMVMATAASSASTPDELSAKCDEYASDPKDPNAYAAPVEDGRVARGAAVEVCSAAIDAKPDFARGWYQLGRAHHLAGRDADALHAYAKAASLGYAAAMSAIGDAYFTGAGLPPSEPQSTALAIVWYNKAISAGDGLARDALSNAQKAVAATKFDSRMFQNPEYMTDLYNGTSPSNGSDRAHFLSYILGLADSLGGDTMFFLDQDCQHFIFNFNTNSTSVEVSTLINKSMLSNGLLNLNNDVTNGIVIDKQTGERDAKTLMHAYSCKSDIVRQVAATISAEGSAPVTAERIGGMFPGPLGEIITQLGGIPGINSRTPPPDPKQQAAAQRTALIAGVRTNCDRTFSRPGFCECVSRVLSEQGVDDGRLSTLQSDFHALATIDTQHTLASPVRGCFKTPA